MRVRGGWARVLVLYLYLDVRMSGIFKDDDPREARGARVRGGSSASVSPPGTPPASPEPRPGSGRARGAGAPRGAGSGAREARREGHMGAMPMDIWMWRSRERNNCQLDCDSYLTA